MSTPPWPASGADETPRARRRATRAVAVPLVVVLAVALAGGGGMWVLSDRGCSAADQALVAPLLADPILDLVPEGAEPVGEPVVGACDEDEDVVRVRRALAFSDAPAAVEEYYATEGARLGWARVDDDGVLCLSRSIDDTTAYFWVRTSGPDPGVAIEAAADHRPGC